MEASPDEGHFGVVVFRGEMKPDEWPKYRYVLLELWRPNDATVEEVRKTERDLCRRQHSKRCMHAGFGRPASSSKE